MALPSVLAEFVDARKGSRRVLDVGFKEKASLDEGPGRHGTWWWRSC